MTALTGTDKQIAWAEKIRSEKLTEMRKFIDGFMIAGRKAGHSDAILTAAPAYVAITVALAKIEAQQSASWWIDVANRQSPRDLLKSMR
jgi:hypothetical protein